VDESFEKDSYEEDVDLVGITVMTQLARRAYKIADTYRKHGVKVVMGGIHPSAVPEEAPVWLLSDAVFARDLKSSHRLAEHLLKESGSSFPLLSYLRSQFDLGLKLTEAYLCGGREKAQLVAPQLRGSFLDKKVQSFMNYGTGRLKRGLQLMMKTELRAKSESIDTSLLFEILVAKLCA